MTDRASVPGEPLQTVSTNRLSPLGKQVVCDLLKLTKFAKLGQERWGRRFEPNQGRHFIFYEIG